MTKSRTAVATLVSLFASAAGCEIVAGLEAHELVAPSQDGSTDSGANDATPNDAQLPDSGPTDSGPIDAGTTFSVSIDKIPGSAGDENTRCITKRLGNTTAVHVGTLHTTISGGVGTELVVYKVDDTFESATPTDCSTFHGMVAADGGTALTVVQSNDELLQFPPADGFTLGPNQMIRLELHATYVDDAGVDATAEFTTMADSTFVNEVGMVFAGTFDILIPPGASVLVNESFPVPSVMNNADLLVLSGHQHQYGTGVALSYGPDGGGTALYDDGASSPSDPMLTVVPANQQMMSSNKFGLNCKWVSGSGAQVVFGLANNDEECFIRAHYAPSGGTRVCLHTNQSGGSDLCCPGGGAACDTLFQ